jgi:MFS family permease
LSVTGAVLERQPAAARTILLALAAAWLGWGFDVFDAHLISYVARPVLKALLEHPDETAINRWLAALTSLFLVGWAAGGILFGRVADSLGRARTMLLTMVLYGGGTAACALCHGLPSFVACRLVASLGIGGEWAAGASLVAEVAPDRWRPLAGALLYTASPLGQLLTSKVGRYVVDQDLFDAGPGDAWRYAFLFGLAPAVVAFGLRFFVGEPARWRERESGPTRLVSLFEPELRRRTLTGLALATVALLGAWGILSFVPKAIQDWYAAAGLSGDALAAAKDAGNVTFLVGGTLGTLATVPASMLFGRRGAFAIAFAGALVAAQVSFGAHVALETRIRALFFLGFFAHGLFGIFPFYLPELFPTRIRGTGAGFCYSTGRLLSAVGVFFVGGVQASLGLTETMLLASWVYVLALLTLPFAVETKGAKL